MATIMTSHLSTCLLFIISVDLVLGKCETCFNGNCNGAGHCIDGCLIGYFGKKCQVRCQPTCLKSMCHLDTHGRSVCTIGCTPGFYGNQCLAPCFSVNIDNMCDRYNGHPPVCNGSTYGNRCQHYCNGKCLGFACNNEGECVSSCVKGRYGIHCTEPCPLQCSVCDKSSGDCVACKKGFHGNSCLLKCPSCLLAEQRTKYKSIDGCKTCDNDEVYNRNTSKSILQRLDRLSLDKNNNTPKPSIWILSAVVILLLMLCILLIGSMYVFKKNRKLGRKRSSARRNVNKSEEDEFLLDTAVKCQVVSEEDSQVLKQRISSLEAKLEEKEKAIEEQQQRIRTNDVPPYDVSYLRAEIGVSLLCTVLRFDRKKCNTSQTHITEDGQLLNQSDPHHKHKDERLQKYWGTCSTFPLTWTQFPQYLEINANIHIDKVLSKRDLLLEIGLVGEEKLDSSHCLTNKSKSYRLNVAHCTEHDSICASVWIQGTKLTCVSDILKNRAPNSTKLQYGILYDYTLCRVAFLDIINNKVVTEINGVDDSVLLWPLFGVFYPNFGTVSMSLLCGSDIDMTEEKKQLILSCLTERHHYNL